MKNFYLVATVEQNGKYVALAERIANTDNIVSVLKRKHYINGNICESRKAAEEIAAAWNENYKANRTYLFD